MAGVTENDRNCYVVRARSGFTIVELLTALLVSAIILAAAATLGSALDCAVAETGRMGENQAVLRQATQRISELIRFSNSVESATADGVGLWADEDADGIVALSEMFFLEIGADTTSLVLRTSEGSRTLIPVCTNIQFVIDQPAPATRYVGIMFDMEVGGATNTYQAAGSLICSAGHKL